MLGLAIRLMSGALLSKVLGLVREIAMALIIGTAMVADAFRASITLILLPISIFQAEMVPAVLIPMQQEKLREGRGATALAALTIALAGISLLLMLALQLLSTVVVDWFVAGFSAKEKALTVQFVQIMALAMPASVALNVLASGEIALGRARISNARAAFQNISVLIGIACVALGGDFILLGWAFAIAFNAVALWACIMLSREGHLSATSFKQVLEAGTQFLIRLKPFIPLPVAEQANIWLERLFASRLQSGAIASLDYARTLTESFQLLVSQPVGLSLLSHMDSDRQQQQAEAITRVVLAFALPTCAYLYMFSEEIVTLVFKRGAFDAQSVLTTSQALSGIAIGLWASTLGWILLRLLNGSGRNLRAAMVLICAYAANMLFNIVVWKIVPTQYASTMLIGFGETIRSMMLLGGVLLCLPGSSRLVSIIALAMLPAGAMLAGGYVIDLYIDAFMLRIVAGAAVLAVILTGAAALLAPFVVRPVLASLRLVSN